MTPEVNADGIDGGFVHRTVKIEPAWGTSASGIQPAIVRKGRPHPIGVRGGISGLADARARVYGIAVKIERFGAVVVDQVSKMPLPVVIGIGAWADGLACSRAVPESAAIHFAVVSDIECGNITPGT
jgi:hypothetical protein